MKRCVAFDESSTLPPHVLPYAYVFAKIDNTLKANEGSVMLSKQQRIGLYTDSMAEWKKIDHKFKSEKSYSEKAQLAVQAALDKSLPMYMARNLPKYEAGKSIIDTLLAI